MSTEKDIRLDTGNAQTPAVSQDVLNVLKADGHLTKAENDYIKANFLKDSDTISAFANEEIVKMIQKDYAIANEKYLGGPAGVTEMQRKLKSKGYKEVVVNGVFTKETFFALIAFQKEARLSKVDGIAGAETQQALGMQPRNGNTVDGTKTAKLRAARSAGPARDKAAATPAAGESGGTESGAPASENGTGQKRTGKRSAVSVARERSATQPATAPIPAPDTSVSAPKQAPSVSGTPEPTTVESAPLAMGSAFFRDGAYYLTGPKGKPVLVETGEILKSLGLPKEAGENFAKSRMKLESIGYALEGLLQKFPKDREAILETGKALEELANNEKIRNGSTFVTLDDGLFGEKWKKAGNVSKYSKDLLRIANASPEKWLTATFAFVRNELGQYSMVGETLISRQWEKAIGNVDDAALAKLLEDRRLGKDVSQSGAFMTIEEHLGKDTINKMLDKANSAGIDANTNWEKNLGAYLAEFRAQYPWKEITTDELEKSRIAFRNAMTLSEAKKYLLSETLKKQSGAFWLDTKDPELKMLSEILWSGAFRLSDRQADIGGEVATFLAVEAIAIAAGVVTAGVGTYAVNALAFGRHAARGAKMVEAYSAAGKLKRGGVTVWRLVGGGAGFEVGAAGVRSYSEGENMYSKEGFAQAVAMNVVLHGLGTFLRSSKAPAFLKTKEGAKIWENRVPLASQIAIEGTAIGLTAGTVGMVFFEKDHLWSVQEMGQAILMAALFKGAKSVRFTKAKNGDIVATPEGGAQSVRTTAASAPAGAPGTPEFVGPQQPFVGPPAPKTTPARPVTLKAPTAAQTKPVAQAPVRIEPTMETPAVPAVSAKAPTPAKTPNQPAQQPATSEKLRPNGLPERVEGGKVVPLPEGKRGYKTPDGKITEIPQSEVRYYSGLPPLEVASRKTPLPVAAKPEAPSPETPTAPTAKEVPATPALPIAKEPAAATTATDVAAKNQQKVSEMVPPVETEAPTKPDEIPAFLVKGSPESAAYMEASARQQAEMAARGPYVEPTALPKYPTVKPFSISRGLEAASYSSRDKAPAEIPAWLLKSANEMGQTRTNQAAKAATGAAAEIPATKSATTVEAGTAEAQPAVRYSKKEARRAAQDKTAEEREYAKSRRDKKNKGATGKDASVATEKPAPENGSTVGRFANDLDAAMTAGKGTTEHFDVSTDSKWRVMVRWSGWSIDQFDDGTYSLHGKIRQTFINGQFFANQKELIEFLRLPG